MQIERDKILLDRPFTHPAYTAIDQRQIGYMLLRLSQVVSSQASDTNPNLFHPESHELFESDGRHHRIIPIRPQKLANARSLTIVGFFGQRNLSTDGQGLASRDKMLAEEMRKHPGLLSYSSIELTNGDYGNCVIFENEQTKDNWGYSPVHTEAVDILSPLFYRSIRLYNGIIQGNIYDFYRLKITIVKYYQYTESGVWSGKREL